MGEKDDEQKYLRQIRGSGLDTETQQGLLENLKDANYAEDTTTLQSGLLQKKEQMSLDEAKGKLSVSDDDMYEDTTEVPIEADEMKEMAESKKDSDPAHDKAFKESFKQMIDGDDGYYAALNQALGQSKRAENRAQKDADKETKAGYPKDMAEAVRYLNAKKKGQNKAAKTEIKPAVKPETAKKGANKTKPAPIEKPKVASKEGKEALKTRSKEISEPKSKGNDAMPYSEYTKNIQNKNTRDEWVKENMDRIKDAGFYDALPDKYKTGNEEPKKKEPKKDKKKTTSKKNTKRGSDDEAKRAMGL